MASMDEPPDPPALGPASASTPESASTTDSRATRTHRWTTIAVVFGLLAVASCLVLVVLFPDSALVWVVLAFAAAGIGAGLLVLERVRGRSGWAIGAVAGAGVAGVVAIASVLPLPDLAAHAYGYADCVPLTGTPPADIDAGAFMTAFYAPSLVGQPSDRPPRKRFGTALHVVATADEGANQIASFTVGQPVDVTDAGTAAVGPPAQGTYLAVPVTLAAIDEGAMACFDWHAPPSYWRSGPGAGAATQYITVAIPGYPTIEDGGVDNGDGTFTYYEIFDVAPSDAANGRFQLDLLQPDGTIQAALWEE